MPYQTFSALSPNGDAPSSTPLEQDEYNRRRDWIQQQYLQQNLQAQLAMNHDNNQTALQTAGAYTDRANTEMELQKLRGDQSMAQTGLMGQNAANIANISGGYQLAGARVANEPQMGQLDMERTAYNDSAPLRQAQAQGEIDMSGMRHQLMTGGQGGQGIMGNLSPMDRTAIARGMFGIQGPSMQEQMMDHMAQAMMQNNDWGGLQKLNQAAQSGDFSQMPQMQMRGNPSAIREQGQAEQLVEPEVQQLTSLLGQHGWMHSSTTHNRLQGLMGQIQSKLSSAQFTPDAINQVMTSVHNRLRGAYADSYSAIQPWGGDQTKSDLGIN